MFPFNIFMFLAFSLSVFDESQYNLLTQWKKLLIVSDCEIKKLVKYLTLDKSIKQPLNALRL